MWSWEFIKTRICDGFAFLWVADDVIIYKQVLKTVNNIKVVNNTDVSKKILVEHKDNINFILFRRFLTTW